uniref:Delta like non-canonical Notch ligand 2 n=1 Tax=Chelonoidis abingdonii TaxID=106734 RepID=A0A8C0J472_CHEAB
MSRFCYPLCHPVQPCRFLSILCCHWGGCCAWTDLPVSSCRCDPGWEGKYCEQCVRMPGCVHGTCHQPWQCICHNGWADVHICEHELPCQNGAECVYEGDGEYSCLCPEGFHGKDCERKTGPCEKAGFPCRNGGQCQDENGFARNFICRCLAGFVGALCENDVDDCLMRPCANGATCHDGINRFSCQCQVGFEGRFCTINIDDCASHPCKNGAKCYDRINDFDCLCPDGFTGKMCEVSTPEPTWVTFYLPANRENNGKASGGGLLKISVKEVVTQRDTGLSESQLVTVLVFGILTAALVLVTILLMLRNWQRGRQRSDWCKSPSQAARKLQEQECQVSILNTVMIEPRKTTEL